MSELNNNSTELDNENVECISRQTVINVIEKLQSQYTEDTETGREVIGVLQAAKSIIQGI